MQLERKSVTVKEAMRATGLGRNSFYELLHAGKIRALRVGRKWVIPVRAIDEFLEQTGPARGQ